jgi:choice-of-anchor A domain-containing protein
MSPAPTARTSISTAAATTSARPAPRSAGNNEVIKAVPGAGGIAVFDITAAQLDAIPSYQMNLNGASTVIFNVSGTSINFGGNDETGTTGAHNIIWNFYQATGVNLSTQIAGTVLAPLAHVTNGNQIDGALVAKSWTGQGELHDYGFTGYLPPTIPEPSVWAMLLVGFGGLGAVLRRRRARAGLAGADLRAAR